MTKMQTAPPRPRLARPRRKAQGKTATSNQRSSYDQQDEEILVEHDWISQTDLEA